MSTLPTDAEKPESRSMPVSPISARHELARQARFVMLAAVSAAVAFGFAATSHAAALLPITSDSFTRANSTTLGTTDNALGGSVVAGYTKRDGNFGTVSPVSTAQIASNRLLVHGDGALPDNPGMVLLDQPFGDNIRLSTEVRMGINNPAVGTTLKNMPMFALRRSSLTTGYLQSTIAGAVDVWFGPNGYVLIREWTGIASFTVMYDDNPFIAGTQTLDAVIHAAGTLPTTINGLPFDADGDGTLESNEPFTLSVDLYGSMLDVLLNGEKLLSVSGFSVPVPGQETYLGVSKNRFSGANTHALNIEFDNLVVSQIVPEPSTLILLGLGAVGMAFHYRRRVVREAKR